VRDYCAFIKIGQLRYMEKLLYEGEIFCKPLKYFAIAEQESLRHDKYEGAAYLIQMKNFQLFHPLTKKPFATVNSGQLYYHHPDDEGNIYCLFGIETNTLNLIDNDTKPLNLEMSGLNFGDTAIIIFEPGTFIERVRKEVEKAGYLFQHSPVIYYDEKIYQGELSPFYKSKKFSMQNEIRFWVPNKLEIDLTFKIGNISDIAKLLPKQDVQKLGYQGV
jgi:hypothetical protein